MSYENSVSDRPPDETIAFTGPKEREEVISSYCLPTAPIWSFDVQRPEYNVPFRLGRWL